MPLPGKSRRRRPARGLCDFRFALAAMTPLAAPALASAADFIVDGITTTLSGANDYNGTTQIKNGGVLNLGNSGAFPTTVRTPVTFSGAGSTLNLATFSDTVASLASVTAGDGVVTNNGATGNSTLSLVGSLATDFSGILTDGNAANRRLNLTINNSNAQTLSGSASNNYTGVTTVTAGTLQLGKSGSAVAIGTGGLVVNGGTVRYVGSSTNTIHDSASVTLNGGTLNLNNAGTDTIASLTFNAGTLTSTGGERQLTLAVASGAALSIRGGVSSNSSVPIAFSSTVNNTVGLTYDAANNSTATFAGQIDLNNSATPSLTRLFTINNNATADPDLDITGVVASNNNSGVSINGGGTLQLSGAASNTYSGETTLLAGTLNLNKSGTANAFQGNLLVSGGVVRYTGSSTDMIVDPAVMHVNGGSLDLGANRSDTVGLAILSSGSITGSGTSTITSLATIDVRSGFVTAILAGGNGLNKIQTGTVTLSGVNTYTGSTTIFNGTLVLGATASINSSDTITVQSIGHFDVAGVSGGYQLTNQTLRGTGTVHGAVRVSSGSTVAPGPASGSTIGTLSADGSNWRLEGTAAMEISRAGAGNYTNDRLAGVGFLSYGGVLSVSRNGGDAVASYTAGDSWNLFDFTSGSFSGVFGNNAELSSRGGTHLPQLSSVLAWNFDYASGVLSIVPTVTAGQVTISASVEKPAVLLNGKTAVTATIANTGSGIDDSVSFTGLIATGGGNPNATISGVAGGGTLAIGQSAGNTATLTGNGYDAGVTVSGTIASATNINLDGDANVTNAPAQVVVVGYAMADNHNRRDSFGGALTAAVASDDSYGGLESKAKFPDGTEGAGVIGTVARIAVGANASGGDETVAMAWRTRNVGTGAGSEAEIYPGQTPPMLTTPASLASDVVRLRGMENQGDRVAAEINEFGRRFETDAFALEISYDAVADEAISALRGDIFMVWLDPDFDHATDGTTTDNATIGDADDRWVPATAGNFGQGASFAADPSAYSNVQGSWDDFAALHGIDDTNIADWVGAWGVDTQDWTDGDGQTHQGRVWAVLNHNSDFSVVPEPASLGAIGLAGASMLGRRSRTTPRRRRK